MLVLSRRQQDKVVFPNLGITVSVIRIEGKAVRLGIDAPRDVRVLRHEIADSCKQGPDSSTEPQRGQKLSHALRNRLNAATLGLHLLHRQIQAGQTEKAEPTILKILDELQSMEQHLGGKQEKALPAPNSGLRKALLVEDNANESELLAAYLRTRDFEVVTARDGVDALQYLSDNEKPHVVLLDMSMPRMDGPATIHEIRSDPANAGLKVFAVTGLAKEDVKFGADSSGADRWFQKPIKPDVLVSEIDRELQDLQTPA